jgi:AcrR family transcriptional regulator
VQRHTVYRHFPSDADLFGACSTHYFAANPWPDTEPWRMISDPEQQLRRALDELYAWYERTEPMFSNVLRDVELVDALRPTLVPLQAYLAEAATILAAGRQARGRRRRVLAAALNHAVDFQTWRSLTANGRITRAEAVELAAALVAGATARRPELGGRRAAPREQ